MPRSVWRWGRALAGRWTRRGRRPRSAGRSRAGRGAGRGGRCAAARRWTTPWRRSGTPASGSRGTSATRPCWKQCPPPSGTGRKERFNDALNTFYLWKEGNVLFNDALNTFYLWKEGNVLFNYALNTFCLWKEGNVLFNNALNTFYLWKEGNVLFNDAFDTLYLRLYGVRHMVKDYSDSERGNPLPPPGLVFPISSKGSFICTIPQTV